MDASWMEYVKIGIAAGGGVVGFASVVGWLVREKVAHYIVSTLLASPDLHVWGDSRYVRDPEERLLFVGQDWLKATDARMTEGQEQRAALKQGQEALAIGLGELRAEVRGMAARFEAAMQEFNRVQGEMTRALGKVEGAVEALIDYSGGNPPTPRSRRKK